MKTSLIALALLAIAPSALAQASSSAVNRMEVSSSSYIEGVGNTRVSKNYNTQNAAGIAITSGLDTSAIADADNTMIDLQSDVIVGEHNLVGNQDANTQTAIAGALGTSYGGNADAWASNGMLDNDERTVTGYSNYDLREKQNVQNGISLSGGFRATEPKQVFPSKGYPSWDHDLDLDRPELSACPSYDVCNRGF